jgi:uncharacterized protein YndB with AHSA1/START domain
MAAKSDRSDREIVMSRVFDFPRELVFKAWTEPEHFQAWMGPNGFTNTMIEFDLKVGGRARFIMHGPDGTDYPNRLTFKEIKKPELLDYSHGARDEEGPDDFQQRITFEALSPTSTKVTMRLRFATAEACEAVKKFGAVEGGQQTLAKLGEHLKRM